MSLIKWTSFVFFIFLNGNLFAVEKFYYGDIPKLLEINSKDSMLLNFPSAPLSVSCQPSGIVDLTLIESDSDLQMIPSLNSNPTLLDSFKKSSIQESEEGKISGHQVQVNPLANILKLNPTREGKESKCSISLSSGEVATIRFLPKEGVFRPLVRFESAFSNANPLLSLSINYLDVFAELIKGNGIKAFDDLTKDVLEKEKKTKLAEYKLLYLSTNRSDYKAWIFSVKLKSDISNQLTLLSSNVGDVFVSSLLRSDITKKSKFKKDEELFFYILTRSSLSSIELFERLP